MKTLLLSLVLTIPAVLHPQQKSYVILSEKLPLTTETAEAFFDELDTWHGVPYLKGEASKDKGVDAAGLIRSVFSNVCGLALPSTPDSLWNNSPGQSITLYDEDLLPGDILFFKKKATLPERRSTSEMTTKIILL